MCSEVPGSNLGRSTDCSEVLGGSSYSFFAQLRTTPIDDIREVYKTDGFNQTTALFFWSGREKLKNGTVFSVHALRGMEVSCHPFFCLKMEVSGQSHASAALPLWKELPVSIE